MPQKFPFEDTLLKDLGVVQPDQTTSNSVDTIIRLAKHFPQLGLADSASLDHLREEFLDFCLSPMDLPTPGQYLVLMALPNLDQTLFGRR